MNSLAIYPCQLCCYITDNLLSLPKVKKQLLLFLTFLFFIVASSAQTTIWSEDFESSSNGDTTGTGTPNTVTTWSTNNGDFDVNQSGSNKRLSGIDLNPGTRSWTTTAIDISSYSGVKVSLDVFEEGDTESDDFLRAQYSFDGTNWINFFNETANFGSTTAVSPTLSGTNLYLRVQAENSTTNERHGFDNVLVRSTPYASDFFCDQCNSCPAVNSSPNPDLGVSCQQELDVTIVIDESGSLGSDENNVKAGVLAFLQELSCTPVRVAIIEFSSTARYVVSDYTAVDATLISNMTGYFDGVAFNGQTYNATGSTNWQAAMILADGVPTPADLLLVFTDGVPTSYSPDETDPGGSSNTCGSGNTTQPVELYNPVQLTNKIKGEGTHIFALGVGGGVDVSQLQAISGPTAYNPAGSGDETRIITADYVVDPNIDNLANCFATIANDICPLVASLEGSTICENDSDGTITVGISPGAEAPYTITVTGGSLINPLVIVTNNLNEVIPNLGVGNYTVEVEASGDCFGTFTDSVAVLGEVCCTPAATCDLQPIDDESCEVPDAFTDPADVFSGIESCGDPVTMDHEDVGDTDICGDGDGAEFTRTYTLYFDGQEFATCEQIIIINAPELSLEGSCPSDPNLDGCSSQDDINSALADWLSDLQSNFSASGGCNASVEFSPDFNSISVPTPCNTQAQTVEVSVKAVDDCGETSEVVCTFTVNPYSDDLSLSPKPADVTTQACVDPADEFDAWISALNGMTASGGCNAEVEYSVDPNTLSLLDGYCNLNEQVISVDIRATDDCTETSPVTATFTVPAYSNDLALSADCPGDPQLTGCATSQEINDAWNNWINGLNAISATGGCNAFVEYSIPINELVKPNTCGDQEQVVSIMINAKDDCGDTEPIECTFTVGPYENTLAISECPSDPNLDGCSTQAEIDAAWNTWISGLQAMTANGSCGSAIVNFNPAINSLQKPSECGNGVQQVSVDIDANDLCGQVGGVTCTFTVNPAPILAINEVPNVSYNACDLGSQDAIDQAYADWIALFGFTGGCNPSGEFTVPSIVDQVPEFCSGANTRTATYAVSDLCDSGEETATFELIRFDEVEVMCPDNVELPAGTSEQDIIDAYNLWVSGFGFTGGCQVEDISGPIPELPPFDCGTRIELSHDVTINDACGNYNCSSEFVVLGEESLEITCPDPVNLDACTSEGDIVAAYNAWVAGFSVDGGINATSNIGDIPQLPDYVCGAAVSLSFTLEASDDCDIDECSSTFDVAAPAPLELVGHCDFLNDIDGCSTQEEINEAFGNWKTGVLSNFNAVGGCNPEVEYSTDVSSLQAPSKCADQDQVISVMVNAADDCGKTQAIECTFTLRAFVSTLELNEVEDESYPACDFATQEELSTAFQNFLNKFGFSGGCDANGGFDDQYSEPVLCVGGNVEVSYTVQDLCEEQTETANFTIVPSEQLMVDCPTGVVLDASSTEQEILDAYNLWIQGFTKSGGCDPTDNIDTLPELPEFECGTEVDLSFDYTAFDRCNPNGVSCNSTFFVPGITGLSVKCPDPVDLDACTSEGDIVAAYNAWVSGFEVNDGDNPTSNIGDIPELPEYVCGEPIDLQFTLTAFDDCNPNGVFCSSSFKLAAPELLELEGHCDFLNDIDGCSTQEEINEAFGNWKTGVLSNFNAVGGCNPEVEYSTDVSSLQAPSKCADQDQVISVMVNAADDCGKTQAIECTFTLRAFVSTLELNEVEDESYPACDYATQDELNSAFSTFLSQFGFSGGCDASGDFDGQYEAPDLCTGGNVEVSYTVQDLCEEQTETANFTIVPSEQLMVDCPTGVVLDASSSEQEILDAYNLWIQGFTKSGGCNPTDNLNQIPSLPEFECGTEVDLSFDYTAFDRCNPNGVSCNSTFFVPGITGLSVKCPDPVDLNACTSEGDIVAAYNAWVSGFEVNDGDNPTSNIGDIPELPEYVCGEPIDLQFTLTAFDDCNPNGVSCSSSFKLAAPDPLELVGECPGNNVLDGCSSDAEIGLAFNDWITGLANNFSATGGCNPEVEYSADIFNLQPPTQCADQSQVISVMVNAADDCGKTQAIECTFTVRAYSSTLQIEEVDDESYESCEFATQDELEDAFYNLMNKFGFTGGCDALGGFDDQYEAPDLCEGGTVEFSYTVVDLCEELTETASFTVEPSDPLTVDCPVDVSLGDDQTLQQIQDAYNAWAAGFTKSGGCEPADNLGELPPLPPYECDTDISISFTYTAFDRCNPNGVSCTSTFEVDGKESVSAGDDGSLTLCSNDQNSYNLYDQLTNADLGGVWTGPDNQPTDGIFEVGDLEGVYQYTVQGEAPCPDDTATVTVVVNTNVEAGDNGTLEVCEDDEGSYDLFNQLVLADGGGSWTGPDDQPSDGIFEVGDLEGVYTYTVLAEEPCEDKSATVTVTVEPLPTIQAGDPECNESDDFGTYSVNVTTSEGIVTSDFGTPVQNNEVSWTINDIPNGQDVTITTTTASGCDSSITVEAPECICIELDLSYTDVTCIGENDGTIVVDFVTEGATVTINGQPYVEGMLYGPGDYEIVAFFEGNDDDRCIIEETITIDEPDEVFIAVSSTDVTCNGADDGTITIDFVSEGAIYTIKKNGVGNDLSGQSEFEPGYYAVHAFLPDVEVQTISTNGEASRVVDPCTYTVVVQIKEPKELECNIDPYFPSGKMECGENNSLNALVTGGTEPYSYSWAVHENLTWDILSDDDLSEIEIWPGMGWAIYELTVTDANGCVTTCNISLFNKCKKSIKDYNRMAPTMSLYPNPVKDKLNIQFETKVNSDVTIEVFDLVGSRAYQKTYKSFSDNNISVDFANFRSNVYYVKITTKNGTTIRKVLLDK
ncbi:T9SS type A sorting domain-containing protein [Winogradskyella sp. 3972H.M.0a.05]|uniref:T9SS type A sorting domain-containing protein n=1 Tax=Winogradskyella sp. 3972H.M.0a.05 TaxID=2950277 RepID=UPI00339375CC